MDFFGRSPWGGSPFSGNPRLGGPQMVASAQPTIDDRELRANGGRIVVSGGRLWFHLDRETVRLIERLTARRPPAAIPVAIRWCDGTPPFLPVLGGFLNPGTGQYCELDLPPEWISAWKGAGLEQVNLGQAVAPGYDPVGIPPYWGEWGVVDKGSGGYMKDCGKVGPYDTIDGAFRAAADAAREHGAETMPADGFAQVKDSRGRGVGPII